MGKEKYDKNNLTDSFGDFSIEKLEERWVRAKETLGGSDKMLDYIIKSAEPIRLVEILESIEKNFGFDV